MKKYLLIVFVFNLSFVLAQNPWTQLTSFYEGRMMAVSFEINGKIYVCGGQGSGSQPGSLRNDLWQFDPATNSWARRADFPGAPRTDQVGFSLNGYGYVGLGTGYFTNSFKDFYKYDPNNDSWTRIQDYPTPAQDAFSFVLNGVAYVGGGLSNENNYISWYTSFYSYDPGSNSWNSKADVPRYINYGAAFGVNGKGYAGLGWSGKLDGSFYQYDPSSNTWAALQNFPGSTRESVVSISSPRFGYIFLGDGAYSTYFSEAWQFDSNNLSWTKLSNFPDGGRTNSCGAYSSNTNSIFLGLGSGNMNWDWWQFRPDCIHSPSISGPSLICSSGGYSINDMAQDATVSWSSSNINALAINSSGIASRVNNAIGDVQLSASVNSSCGNSSLGPLGVWLGQPVFNSISVDGGTSPVPLCGGGDYISYTAGRAHVLSTTIGGAPSVTFALSGASGVTGGALSGTSYQFTSSSSTANFTITATMSNSCNTISQCLPFYNVSGGGGGGCSSYAVSPNPSSNTLRVVVPNKPAPCNSTQLSTDLLSSQVGSTDSETSGNENTITIQSVSLYSLDGQPQFTKQFSDNTRKVDLDISGLKKGIYILRISDGVLHNETKRIIIN